VSQPTAILKSHGRLEALLRSGAFVMTAETSPPDGANAAAVMARSGCLKGYADAVNVTDGAGAKTHMSAMAAAAILAQHGIEPVLQFTVRDRNRMALQGDLIGAAALGIHSILCLHGDDPKNGDQPETRPVYDIDSRTLISTARALRENGHLPTGRVIDPAPRLFIGAADSPQDPKPDWKPASLAAKLEAGVDFIQTQYSFALSMLRRYLDRLRDHGILERLYVLVGIGPIVSAKSARWMNENLFGVHIPDAIVQRLEKSADQRAEGRRICVELLQQLAEMEGVAGAHLMAHHQEQAIAETIAESGLLQKREAA
jgi:methylenetetrahydrofolate reductase (NADPH)